MDDLTGKQFGRWKVIKFIERRKDKHLIWECHCTCGTIRAVTANSLKFGSSKSCGCFLKDFAKAIRTTHGLSKTPEYRIWAAMLQRCHNPKDKNFHLYGGRGITVCEEWHEFANFIKDIGRRPDPSLSVDRTDNEKGYGPDNCKWATLREQFDNRRITRFVMYRGHRVTVRKAMEIYGSTASIKLIDKRIFERGWDITRAIEKPP